MVLAGGRIREVGSGRVLTTGQEAGAKIVVDHAEEFRVLDLS